MLTIVVPEINYVDYILKEARYEIINETYQIYQCEYESKDFLIIITGYGKVNIALALEFLTVNYEVDALLSLGIAGTVSPKINILDIIIPNNVVQIDIDFTSIGYDLLTLPNEIKSNYNSNEELNRKIIKSFKNLEMKYHNCFIGSADSLLINRNKSMNYLNIGVIDIDSGVIGMIAYKKKIPFSGIKIVTYKLDCYAINQYSFYKKQAILKAQKVFLNFIG